MVNKTRHLSLTVRSYWSRRNIIVVALLAAWLLSAAGVSLWLALQTNQYRKDFAAYSADLQQALNSSSEEFKKLHENADTTGTSKALVALADSLGNKVANTPTAPTLFGVRFGTEAETAKQTAIAQSARAYAASLKEAAVYVDYQQKVAAPLGELALKSATNAEQIIQLAAAWQDASSRHGQVSPPERAKQAHEALGQKMGEIQTRIAQLGEFYAKTNIPGFTAKQKELEVSIESLKPIGEQFAAFAKEYDASLSTNLQALRSNL